MYRIKVVDGFSAAHQLKGYQGRCEGLHGHNWKVEAEVEGENLDDVGMLVDFKILKGLLRKTLDELDHQMLNELEAFQNQNPSAELIARFIYSRLKTDMPNNANLAAVYVWESETSRATYFEV